MFSPTQQAPPVHCISAAADNLVTGLIFERTGGIPRAAARRGNDKKSANSLRRVILVRVAAAREESRSWFETRPSEEKIDSLARRGNDVRQC
jgi:hypothetical protein